MSYGPLVIIFRLLCFDSCVSSRSGALLDALRVRVAPQRLSFPRVRQRRDLRIHCEKKSTVTVTTQRRIRLRRDRRSQTDRPTEAPRRRRVDAAASPALILHRGAGLHAGDVLGAAAARRSTRPSGAPRASWRTGPRSGRASAATSRRSLWWPCTAARATVATTPGYKLARGPQGHAGAVTRLLEARNADRQSSEPTKPKPRVVATAGLDSQNTQKTAFGRTSAPPT